MPGSITGASAVFMLSITPIFPTPIQLQQFAADDVFSTDPLESSEVVMGVDGVLSGGFVFVPIKQNITLQANSPSATLFDQWYLAQQTIKDVYPAQGIVQLPTLSQKWTMSNGFLTTYHPIPDAKKLLQPRRFSITWNTVVPAAF